MALFLIFSESWQSFCQTVQQTFSMRWGEKLCQTENFDEVLAFDSNKSYLRKQVTIGRTATGDLNKRASQ